MWDLNPPVSPYGENHYHYDELAFYAITFVLKYEETGDHKSGVLPPNI
jgi:hypothetical protein